MQAPGSSEVVMRRMMEDLEQRVAEWKAAVVSERAEIAQQWDQIHSEKRALERQLDVLNNTAEEMSRGLQELTNMRTELERRLAVTPMDLPAEALQREWDVIDREKLALRQSHELVEKSLQRLQEVEAALELVQ